MKKNKHRVLITGANGQVGWSLQKTCPTEQIELIAPKESEFDITNQSHIENAIDTYKPHFIVNAAAYTAVDKAEEEKEIAMQVNAEGPLLLAQTCHKKNIPLFHFSTDYVFDGKKESSYTEADQPNPINIYGKSKLIGEENIREHLQEHIILRVSGVFCSHGNNFVKTMLKLAQERTELSIVSDQVTCPTPAIDVSNVVWMIINKVLSGQQDWGTYHYCATPPVSWHQFATEIITLARELKPTKVEQINAISSNEYKCAAIRLKNAVLDCTKIKSTFAIDSIAWKIELNNMIRKLLT